MFKSSAKIIYDPVIEGDPSSFKEHWIIAQCDPEIARYYRWLTKRHACLDWLIKPAWGAHISIARGDAPLKPELWKKHQGQWLEFEYGNEVWTNGRHFWLDVRCEKMYDLREELGLSRKFRFAELHLTIGNLHPDVRQSTPPEGPVRSFPGFRAEV